jgi:hypothetical protein
LSCCIVGPTEADAQAWAGFVESRLRKLVSDNLGRSLPLKKIQLWPKKFEACVAEKTALLSQAQRQNCVTYFIGFLVDSLRMKGSELNVEGQIQKFREWDLNRFQPLVPGMDVLFLSFRVKELPLLCFEGIYPGGKIEAMKKRRQMRNDDPERQKKRQQAKLEDLKARMAEIQRKKQAAVQSSMSTEQVSDSEASTSAENDTLRKRKRSDADASTVEVTAENVDESTDSVPNGSILTGKMMNEEEANQLESALDTMKGETDETRTQEQVESAGQQTSDVEPEIPMDDDEADEDIGYAGEGARQMFYNRSQQSTGANRGKYKRALPIPEEDEELLKKLGYHIVGDDDMIVLGPVPGPGYVPVEEDSIDQAAIKKIRPHIVIEFRNTFDIVELDALGRVIDRGDDDYMPSRSWIGRKAGFEFKLGARGLGYYRTGKEVVIPSKTAYW